MTLCWVWRSRSVYYRANYIKESLCSYMNSSTDKLLSQFKALADPVRTRLVALCGLAECSVSELTKVTGQSQPRISQHVKQLCSVGLLERFKDGHFVYYRVPTLRKDSSARRQLLALLPNDEPRFEKDIRKLREIRAGSDVVAAPVSERDRSLHRALLVGSTWVPASVCLRKKERAWHRAHDRGLWRCGAKEALSTASSTKRRRPAPCRSPPRMPR